METIEVFEKEKIAFIYLNRPEKRNAFGSQMIHEISEAFHNFDYEKLRAVVMQGRGKSFCAGADLEWMKSVKDYSLEENIVDSKELLAMFKEIQACKVPFIVKVQGHVMGGANGIVALADIAIAEEETQFAFSEVKLGIVPALISPYVVEKMGRTWAVEKMLTGRRFSAKEALQSGLIHFSEPGEKAEARLLEIVNHLLSSGPEAVKQTQILLETINELKDPQAIGEYTSVVISERRMSEEGQEGLSAFFEKRKPRWSKSLDAID